jgi:Mn2+/Fe2+ NRAMP family transporter
MKITRHSAILGAAFLMATSAVGPGFLTQTTVFTKQFMASFGFAIVISIVIDIFAQLNIWRILTVTGKRAQEVASDALPGAGWLLAILITFGGLAFNIGNLAGAGLGLEVLFGEFGMTPILGAMISAGVAILIFMQKDAGRAMDWFVKVLGCLMLALIFYVVFESKPPIAEAIHRTFIPDEISPKAIVTLVGGTVGGYITFAGAHRLIAAGITGKENLSQVNRSATSGIVLTGLVRFLLFLAAFGVLSSGFILDDKNPPASIFRGAAGELGYKFFGMVMWAAAITSVIGAAFTSISFLKSKGGLKDEWEKPAIVIFILVSLFVFTMFGRPVSLLLWAGTINGFILPIGLGLILFALAKNGKSWGYRNPIWLTVTGWLVVLTMSVFSLLTLKDEINKLISK